MKKYRIKEEAVPFINENHVTSIYPLDKWDELGIDINALEQVEEAYISYGIKTSEIGSSLSGWDKKGAHFHFTIHFPSVTYAEHDKFNKGRSVRELMDRIQRDVTYYYEQFSSEDTNV